MTQYNRKHGLAGTKVYQAWSQAKIRSYGRGIVMCRRWRKDFKFFFKDMGLPPSPSHSIDRKDNDGNYSCGRCKQCRRNGWTMNCRWATWRQQQNNRRSNVYVTIDGRRRTLSQWTRFLGLKRGTVLSRVHRGLEYRDALLLPVDKRMSRTNGGPKRRSL